MTSAFSWQNCQSLPCFILHSKAKFACYSRCFLTSYFWIPVPYMKRKSFLGVSSKRSCRSSQNHSISDHELFIDKFRLKQNKVGKTTRPFRYDLNQIPYDYTVEVRNRFKGLDLIDRVSYELWTEVHYILQETGIKTIPMEKKCKRAKWLSGEALQITVRKKRSEKQRRKGKI